MSLYPADRPRRHSGYRQDDYNHSSDEDEGPRARGFRSRNAQQPKSYSRSLSISSTSSGYSSPHNRSYRGGPHNSAHTRNGGHRYDNLGKVAIAVGLLQVVAGIFQLWSTRKAAKKVEEERERRRRRREFDRRKKERRREEDKWARQREWDLQRDAEVKDAMNAGSIRGLIEDGGEQTGRIRSGGSGEGGRRLIGNGDGNG
ncbi:hypothetical protein K431DRAFT_100724 [Polychaeton citri CBS 116435]|uniref:Uncharacterized protein n=1 Tax=Polychaeton citri CBS 116435 TaxID=1314669 RepID=A0A9P4QF72_9PEZI|nr:hypothetical protein K431DRAFT_100724 [Polychaeton citri CBS 116435]